MRPQIAGFSDDNMNLIVNEGYVHFLRISEGRDNIVIPGVNFNPRKNGFVDYPSHLSTVDSHLYLSFATRIGNIEALIVCVKSSLDAFQMRIPTEFNIIWEPSKLKDSISAKARTVMDTSTFCKVSEVLMTRKWTMTGNQPQQMGRHVQFDNQINRQGSSMNQGNVPSNQMMNQTQNNIPPMMNNQGPNYADSNKPSNTRGGFSSSGGQFDNSWKGQSSNNNQGQTSGPIQGGQTFTGSSGVSQGTQPNYGQGKPSAPSFNYSDPFSGQKGQSNQGNQGGNPYGRTDTNVQGAPFNRQAGQTNHQLTTNVSLNDLKDKGYSGNDFFNTSQQ